MQTKELKEDSKLTILKSQLNNFALQIHLPKIEDFDIFASYYRKGDYLLCHDDLIDDRQYAFSYYLEDFESGELIMHNKNADKEVKRIKVAANTCVLFQVSSFSFHEVDMCTIDGRMAFTGWLHYNEQHMIMPYLTFSHKQVMISRDSDLMYAEADLNKDINIMNDLVIRYEITKETITGPFYSRRVIMCNHSPLLVFFEGLDLFSKNVYKFVDGCYILLNDSVNNLEGDVWDLFIFVKVGDAVINYVDDNGEVVYTLIGEESTGYLKQRKGHKIFVERTEQESLIKHFIYFKTNK